MFTLRVFSQLIVVVVLSCCNLQTLVVKDVRVGEVMTAALASEALFLAEQALFAAVGVTNWAGFFLKVETIAAAQASTLLGGQTIEQVAEQVLQKALQPQVIDKATELLIKDIILRNDPYAAAEIINGLTIYSATNPYQKVVDMMIDSMPFASAASKKLAHTILDSTLFPAAAKAIVASGQALYIDLDLARLMTPEEISLECQHFFERIKNQTWIKLFALSCAERLKLVGHKAVQDYQNLAMHMHALVTAEKMKASELSFVHLQSIQDYYVDLLAKVEKDVHAQSCSSLTSIYNDLKSKISFYQEKLIPSLQSLNPFGKK